MSKPKILLQIDPDPQPSVFDAVVAIDAGVEQLLRHGAVIREQAQALVHGAIFTRSPADLKYTAIFVGGSNVAAAEALYEECRRAFFGPMRVSTMFDANGSNTTAAAAVLAAGKHLSLNSATAVVLGGTGPVGSRAAHLLALEGAAIRIGSRDRTRAESACREIERRIPGTKLSAVATDCSDAFRAALDGANLVIAAGAAGVKLLSADAWTKCESLQVAIDLNAVPPLGIEGIEVTDKADQRSGVTCYGAIGVGGMKMKIHKAAIQKLFESNDQSLDAAEIYQIGKELAG